MCNKKEHRNHSKGIKEEQKAKVVKTLKKRETEKRRGGGGRQLGLRGHWRKSVGSRPIKMVCLQPLEIKRDTGRSCGGGRGRQSVSI